MALKLVFETMFKYGIVQPNSNTAIIKPLIKDQTKSYSDLNNIRPISISDTFCTLLEKILLKEIDKVHINNQKQFGFKANSSCSHAVFTLTEAIKSSKRKRYKSYICAISKAFDKVNRSILFAKTCWISRSGSVEVLLAEFGDSLVLRFDMIKRRISY